MLKILRLLLFPFTPLYFFIVYVRNKCYDYGLLKSFSFNKPIICVGNLAVGGSGKTPTTLYLTNLLKDYKIAILSRGYGRSTKGFIVADKKATASTIGDEPLQYYNKLKNITVAVCEDRVYGVNQLIANHDVILLDDAYQHRRLKAGLNILLFEQDKLQKSQYLLPTGNLREPLSESKRADIVLITKANKTTKIKPILTKKLKLKHDTFIAVSHIKYQQPLGLYSQQIYTEDLSTKTIILITGIANPNPLYDYLKNICKELKHFNFPDHHSFSINEINDVVHQFKLHNALDKIIITTEKDKQRLEHTEFKEILLNLPIYYLPIRFEINTEDKNEFDQKILDYVASSRRIN